MSYTEYLRQRMAKQAEYVRELEDSHGPDDLRVLQAHGHLLNYVEDYLKTVHPTMEVEKWLPS